MQSSKRLAKGPIVLKRSQEDTMKHYKCSVLDLGEKPWNLVDIQPSSLRCGGFKPGSTKVQARQTTIKPTWTFNLYIPELEWTLPLKLLLSTAVEYYLFSLMPLTLNGTLRQLVLGWYTRWFDSSQISWRNIKDYRCLFYLLIRLFSIAYFFA